ncbi:MAG: hypothetical protein IJ011_07260 [Clostridia bacterium]|nr:hypothetical protein [Clostridia bacterium]
MTQEEKRICAERLFDEIGQIDERFIAEAATPYARKKKKAMWQKLFIAAVSITLMLSILVGVFITSMIIGIGRDKDDGDGGDFAGIGNSELQDGANNITNGESATLSSRLEGLRYKTESLRISANDIKLFESTPKIIWKYSDEESYRVRNITEGEAAMLFSKLYEDRGRRIDGGTDESGLDGVWIATGDGLVISPCLEQSAGNTGYGEIFDYVPEYEPSEDFSEYLCDVIS